MPSWKKVITSGSHAELSSLYAPSITGSLHGTASYAQTASYVNPLIQTVQITGSLIVSSSGTTNDFQVGANKLFISSSGNIGFGTILPQYKLDALGSVGRFHASLDDGANNFLSISGGNDAFTFIEARTPNTNVVRVGIRPIDDFFNGAYGKKGDGFLFGSITNNGLNIISAPGTDTEDYIRFYAGNNALPANTPDIHIQGSGSTRGFVGIGKDTPTTKLDIFGSTLITGSLTVTEGITGSLHGTASWAQNTISASYAQTASYVTASGVYGPYGSNSVISSSYASSSTRSDFTIQTDILVLNQTGFNISKGTVVRITGSNNSSDIPRITTASYEDDAYSANTLGITTQTINNGAQGYVITEGVQLGINTTNFTPGQLIYLGPTGSIIGSPPLAPLHAVRLGQVVRHQSNNGSIHVRIDNGYELNELHNVLITSTSSGDIITWDSSSRVWKNSKQLTGSYGITGSLTATSFTGSLFGTASWAQNAITASYILNAVSASFATSASSVPVSGVVGLNLSQIVTGSVTASVSPTQFTVTSGSSIELIVRGNGVTIGNAATDTHTITGSARITGSLTVTGSTTLYNSGSKVLSVSGSQGELFYVTDDLTGNLFVVESGSAQILAISASGTTTIRYVGSGSGQQVLNISGSQGSLFSIIDSTSGSLLEVNNSSSATIFKVNSDNTILLGDPTASALFTTVKTTTISGSNVIYSLPTSLYDGAFFDYTVRSGSNARAGQIMAIWSGSSVNFTGSVTADFGTTSGISLAVIITGSNMALTGSSTTAGWTVKTIVRGI